MKIKNIAGMAVVAAGFAVCGQAQTTLTAWTFDNLAIGTNSSPQPSAGFGTASAVGLGNGEQSQHRDPCREFHGSAQRLADSRHRRKRQRLVTRMRPLARRAPSLPAARSAITKSRFPLTFMPPRTRKPHLQVQYTTEGSIWHNATITSAGTSGVIANNSLPPTSLVVGAYLF